MADQLGQILRDDHSIERIEGAVAVVGVPIDIALEGQILDPLAGDGANRFAGGVATGDLNPDLVTQAGFDGIEDLAAFGIPGGIVIPAPRTHTSRTGATPRRAGSARTTGALTASAASASGPLPLALALALTLSLALSLALALTLSLTLSLTLALTLSLTLALTFALAWLGIGEALLSIAYLSLGLAPPGSVGRFLARSLELGGGRFEGLAGLSGEASITRRGLQRRGRRGQGIGELLIDSGEVRGPSQKLGGSCDHLGGRGTRETVRQITQLLGGGLAIRQGLLGEALLESG